MNKVIGILLSALLWFSSCKHSTHEIFRLEETINDSATVIRLPDSSATDIQVEIRNASDSAVQFYLTPPGIDFKNYQTLIAGIIKPEMSEEEKAKALWKFASSWTSLGIPPARNQEPCNPL